MTLTGSPPPCPDIDGKAKRSARPQVHSRPMASRTPLARIARFARIGCAALVGLFASPSARADTPDAPALLDRVVVRWTAPETGGVGKPQFIFQRELAFEARLESLADPEPEPGSFHDRHVRAALDLHIGETLLASLPVTPV